MPAFLTHIIFGEDVTALVPANVREIALYNKTAFTWGLIGPDLLFFRKTFFGSIIPKLASRLHRGNAGEIFAAISDYIRSRDGRGDFPILVSYLAGLICHYRLDSITHPFIYAQCDRYIGMTPDRTRGGVHHRIESDIDTCICILRRGTDPTLVSLNHQLHISRTEKEAIGHLYFYIFQSVFQIQIDATQIVKAFSDTILIERVLLDPSGFLVRFFTLLMDKFTKGVPLTSHVVSKKVHYDVLNLQGFPITNDDTPRRDKFSDLYEYAAQDARNDIQQMLDHILCGNDFYPQYLYPFDNRQWVEITHTDERNDL